MQKDYHKLGIGLLAVFFICLIVALLYINPIVDERHPQYNKTQIEPQIGFYMSNIRCPNCNSTNLTIYASYIVEDNRNKKIISFFYCENCSTIFSIRPSQ